MFLFQSRSGQSVHEAGGSDGRDVDSGCDILGGRRPSGGLVHHGYYKYPPGGIYIHRGRLSASSKYNFHGSSLIL